MSQSDWPKFAVVDETTNNAVRSNVSRNGHALKASLYLTLIFWQKQIDNGKHGTYSCQQQYSSTKWSKFVAN